MYNLVPLLSRHRIPPHSLRKKKSSETLPRGGGGNEGSGFSPSKPEGSKLRGNIDIRGGRILTIDKFLEADQGRGHTQEPPVADNGGEEDVELGGLTARSEEREAFSLEDLKTLFECSILEK